MTNLSMSRNLEIMPVATGIQLGSLDTSTGAYLPGNADPEGGVEDEQFQASLNATFANNINGSVSVSRDMERYLGVNFDKLSYRVNAGTVFYIGYDDRYQQGSLILGDDLDGDGIQDYLFPSVTTLQRTNRAFFTKFQYLFRY